MKFFWECLDSSLHARRPRALENNLQNQFTRWIELQVAHWEFLHSFLHARRTRAPWNISQKSALLSVYTVNWVENGLLRNFTCRPVFVLLSLPLCRLPPPRYLPKILKSQLATQSIISNAYKADFWEFRWLFICQKFSKVDVVDWVKYTHKSI